MISDSDIDAVAAECLNTPHRDPLVQQGGHQTYRRTSRPRCSVDAAPEKESNPDSIISTLRPDGKGAPIRLEDDPSTLVRPVHRQAVPCLQCGKRVGPRVTVVVVGADRDHSDPWPKHAQLFAKTLIGGAVVGDLENLDLSLRQQPSHGRLGIARQEQVD